jgi:hypothetical protein
LFLNTVLNVTWTLASLDVYGVDGLKRQSALQKLHRVYLDHLFWLPTPLLGLAQLDGISSTTDEISFTTGLKTTGRSSFAFKLDVSPSILRSSLVLSLPSEQVPAAPDDDFQGDSHEMTLRPATLSAMSLLQVSSY